MILIPHEHCNEHCKLMSIKSLVCNNYRNTYYCNNIDTCLHYTLKTVSSSMCWPEMKKYLRFTKIGKHDPKWFSIFQ